MKKTNDRLADSLPVTYDEQIYSGLRAQSAYSYPRVRLLNDILLPALLAEREDELGDISPKGAAPRDGHQ